MSLFDYIWKRKSTRKYDMAPLDPSLLNQILQFADTLKPLYPNIHIDYEITTDIINILPLKAPYYFLISSEKSEGYLENVGFMFQQMDLYLSSLGLGSCWLGLARPSEEPKTERPFVIALAFGKALTTPYRERSEFKRKPLSPEISNGSDERLEAARLAPSATNNQNWFFDASDGKIDVYQKNPKVPLVYGKMNKIDMGIVLCHLFLATEYVSKEFVFSNELNKVKTGYTYKGTIS